MNSKFETSGSGVEAHERTLQGAERKKLVKELGEHISGLEVVLADPDLPIDEYVVIEEVLEELREALQNAQSGGEIKITE